MPGPERASLPHACTLLARLGADGFGRPTVEAVPEGLPCRWVGRKRTVQGPDGEEVQLDADVYLDREVPAGSLLRRGSPSELPAGTGPFVPDELHEVVSCDGTDDIKGRATAWVATVRRWRQGMGARQ